ncbi:uncharacterized protein LTR77_005875 [Saxophila tyrrhenica]|uniref:Oxidoreductase-like domain-containing protein n=1 Tax=Saxophila tyrrhenica TaxID=1690608 RepID=A0AAV9PCU4_9PEZI|nr:hypothetical protein LTR77_005875 [Saxophila tyrrhenica]
MRRVVQAGLNKSPCCHKPYRGPPRVASTTAHRPYSDNPQPAFPGFEPDTLDAPLSTIIPQTRTQPAPPPAEELPKTEDEEKLAKARVVFGSRLAGPIERRRAIDAASHTVAGVMVPPKPLEPDNCCMSGCVNCVWDIFRDDLEEWAEKSAEARGRLEKQRTAEGTGGQGAMPGHVGASMDEDGGGSGTAWEGMESFGQPGADLFEGIPVGIREFMKTEKKLKERHKREETSGG